MNAYEKARRAKYAEFDSDTQAKRTPTPWTRSSENGYKILTPGGGLLAKTSYHWVDPLSARLNAAFIVKACNSHDELVRQLESAYTALLMYNGSERFSMEYQTLLVFCRGAIASALDESDEVVQNRCERKARQRKIQNT